MAHFGNVLKRLIAQRKLDQVAFAKLADIAADTLYRNLRSPHPLGKNVTYFMIADALGLSQAELDAAWKDQPASNGAPARPDAAGMEEKITWNLDVFASIAGEFDSMVKEAYRGEKGTVASAACLMFRLADPKDRQKWIDFIKLAEGRGMEGSIMEAAQKAMEDELLDQAVADNRPPKKRRGSS